MSIQRLSRILAAAALIAAPLLGLVAAVATPALRSTRSAEITAIAAQPDRFYIYAVCILASSYLLVPAVFAVMGLVRRQRPGWAYLAGGLAQFGLLVAIGDAATELIYWQMGAHSADHAQMAALAGRYEAAPGASLIYSLGGLATLIGTGLLAVALWRSHAVPRWSAAGIILAAVGNIAGFSTASTTLLVASYLALLAAFSQIAAVIIRAAASDTAPSTQSQRDAAGTDPAVPVRPASMHQR